MLFNNVDFTEYLVVEYIRRKLTPPRTIHYAETPGRRVKHFQGVEYDAPTIEVDVRLISDNRVALQSLARTVASLLLTTHPAKLELRDEPDKYNIAILDGETDFEKFYSTGFSTLNFLCLDPYGYSQNESILSDIGGVDVLNEGTAPTTGVVTVTMTANTSYVKLNNVTTGQNIYVDTPVEIGDVLKIDLGLERVSINDILVMNKILITSDFFELPPGLFNLTTNNGQIDLRFRKRWV